MINSATIFIAAIFLTAAVPVPQVNPNEQNHFYSNDRQSSTSAPYAFANDLLPPIIVPRIKHQSALSEDQFDEFTSPHDDNGSPKWTDIVIAALTLGLLIAAWFQWDALRSQVQQLREAFEEERKSAVTRAKETSQALTIAGTHAQAALEQAGASIRAADASQKAADALPRAERAYVFFYDAELGPPVGDLSGSMSRKVTVIFRNFGRTPAIVLGYRLSTGYFEEPPLPSKALAKDMPSGAVIAANDTWGRSIRLEFTQIQEENRQKKVVEAYLYGEIVYRDMFKTDQHAWFCRRYTGKQFVLGDLIAGHFNGST